VSDQLLALITSAGAPALFGILILTSAGAPFPDTLLLLAVGSFVAQGEMVLWQALVFGIAGAVLGDQLGYFAGLYGGRPLVRRITGKLGMDDKVRSAEDFMKRWGGAGIFFTRWLIGPLGPWINLSSGIAGYPWAKFVLWDVLGEIL
jgi:membrane-associated protein